MSIKEKARAYDNILENARKWYNANTNAVYRSIFEDIFPELAESEDERIRKALIDYLRERKSCESYGQYVLRYDHWIAWLEKQSKQSSNILWHDVSEEPDEQREIFCEWEWNNTVWHDVVFYHADTKDFWDGKQKIEGVIKWTYVNEMLGKQVEQKHVDKIEPKFHEGDWVVTDKGDTVQIGTVNNDYYTIGNGMLFSMPYVDTSWHLWTIKDAKEGDVLHSPSHHLIWIYKDIKNYHAWVIMDYVTKNIGTNWFISIPNDVCPATKDEQTILFKRIKEAGYEWNKEKKELIKL